MGWRPRGGRAQGRAAVRPSGGRLAAYLSRSRWPRPRSCSRSTIRRSFGCRPVPLAVAAPEVVQLFDHHAVVRLQTCPARGGRVRW